MICASLAFAVLLNSTVLPSYLDTIPDSDGPFAISQAEQFLQPGKWDPTRFDSATAVGVKALLDSAIAHGLPYGPLYSNALMGVANKKSGAEIIGKTKIRLRNMIDARAALGEGSSADELSAGADVLIAGMDGKALQAIRVVRPSPGSAVTALIVAADFLNRKIPASQARDAITALARASKSDEGLNTAQALVARQAERGPGMARDALDRYVKTSTGGAKNAPGKTPTRPPGPPDAS